jgi:hypothetical protein
MQLNGGRKMAWRLPQRRVDLVSPRTLFGLPMMLGIQLVPMVGLASKEEWRWL